MLVSLQDVNEQRTYLKNSDFIIHVLYYFQYICENHFHRVSKTSIFTGLKAINHFGRPDMTSFLKFVQKKHSYVSIIIQLWNLILKVILTYDNISPRRG